MDKFRSKFLEHLSYRSSNFYLFPNYISLNITNGCNFHCLACAIHHKKPKKELGIKDWLKISQKLSKVFPKNTFIEISGGEPLTKKELIFALIADLKKNFQQVALNTNGLLCDESIAKQLEKLSLDQIKLSFYSLDEKIHNLLRGEPRSYVAAIKAIKLFSKSKIKLIVGILVTSKNIRTIPRLINYLQQFPNCQIILQPLDEIFESKESKNQKHNFLPQHLWPSKKEVLKFFEYVERNKNKVNNSPSHLRAAKNYYLNPESVLGRHCYSGQRLFVIYPNGQTGLCFKHQNLGNILVENPKKILKRDQAKRIRKQIKNCRKYCRILNCNFGRSVSEIIQDKILSDKEKAK
jgi:MoaA/NifB/PqqE/SkfB family radical SAM enzyme